MDRDDWWEVDLGASRRIERIEIHRSGEVQWLRGGMQLTVSDTTIGASTPATQALPGFQGPSATVAVGRAGRYVRLQLGEGARGNGRLRLSEVRVLVSP
jgi:hypothetical protein